MKSLEFRVKAERILKITILPEHKLEYIKYFQERRVKIERFKNITLKEGYYMKNGFTGEWHDSVESILNNTTEYRVDSEAKEVFRRPVLGVTYSGDISESYYMESMEKLKEHLKKLRELYPEVDNYLSTQDGISQFKDCFDLG